MIGHLGPRRLPYTTADGAEGEIEVTIEGLGLKRVDLGDGIFVDEVRARVKISSDWLNKEMEAGGEDDLQTIFYLIRVADVYIQQVCHEHGVSVQTFKAGQAVADFATFG